MRHRWLVSLHRCVTLLLLAVPCTARAHPLDELVQSAFVTVHRDSLFIELDLTAGARVASAYFAVLDRDGNGRIDAAEQHAYVSVVGAALRTTIGGRLLALTPDANLWPTEAQLRAGEGMIRLFWRGALPRVPDGDSIEFVLVNAHAPVPSGYLANALVDPRTLPIARTTRSWTQQQLTLTVVATSPAPTLTGGAVTTVNRWMVLPAFLQQGVYHVAIGFDHVLFVFALLLAGGRWQRILGIVTSFTIAHSITLSLAVLGVIVAPVQVVEAAIAASIVVVGWQALRVQESSLAADLRLPMAFGFGLLHGFGFANAMQGLQLPAGQLPLALGGFNIGVEIAQLAIVFSVWPLLTLIRARTSTRVATMLIRSCAITVMAVGSYWLVERVRAVVS